MKARTKEDFQGKYWGNRWDKYLSTVSKLALELSPKNVLEIGTNGIGLFTDSDTMGIDPKTKPAFLHDATVTPWPFVNAQYDLGIATQVWEHLGTGQVAAFLELKRTCKAAILSFPFLWHCTGNIHHNITKPIIDGWTLSTVPAQQIRCGARLVRVYKF